MLHPQGDLALARAAARLGIPFTLSTLSTTRLEELATRAGGRLWLQLYVLKERAIARDIVQRAGAAGYEALEIGRASCRERVEIAGGAVALKRNKSREKTRAEVNAKRDQR